MNGTRQNALNQRVLALSGGVGGAKLAFGLSQLLPANQLQIITNTADDFEHLGLPISPDLDTVMYTLAKVNNQQVGWGLVDETWQCMSALEQLNGPAWFRLGDKDLATHLQRKQLLQQMDITAVTERLSVDLGVEHSILPMCNESVSTFVTLAEDFAEFKAGYDMPFQHYFVKYQCKPIIKAYHFSGIEQAAVSPHVVEAVGGADVLIVCPSNPFVSIEPILSVPGMTELLTQLHTRVVVSPIVAGLAIKGPAAKMMHELSMPTTALSVASLYRQFATHFVLDCRDEQYKAQIESMGLNVFVTDTVMTSDVGKQRLAADILAFLDK